MTPERFKALFSETTQDLEHLAVCKGGEYAPGADRLGNFRTNAEALGLPMETIWAVYAGKHWDAIRNYVKDRQRGETRPRSEGIEGRIKDLMVYCHLMLGILEEQQENHEK